MYSQGSFEPVKGVANVGRGSLNVWRHLTAILFVEAAHIFL